MLFEIKIKDFDSPYIGLRKLFLSEKTERIHEGHKGGAPSGLGAKKHLENLYMAATSGKLEVLFSS